MDTNNNDFFGEIKEEEFENTNISSSGISYGETPNKLSTKTALLTIATSAVIAAVVIALLTSGNSNKLSIILLLYLISSSERLLP